MARRRPVARTVVGPAALLAALRVAPAHADDRGAYVHTFATAAVGRSLRLNNPYRLEEPLGDGPESLSLGAAYGDVGLGAALGAPNGWQHGATVRWSFALTGVPQDVVTPSYLALFHASPRLQAYGRLGTPFMANPNPNLGGELAAGAAYLVVAGAGVSGELGASAFYGAATREVSATLVPLVFAQVGLWLDWEVLP